MSPAAIGARPGGAAPPGTPGRNPQPLRGPTSDAFQHVIADETAENRPDERSRHSCDAGARKTDKNRAGPGENVAIVSEVGIVVIAGHRLLPSGSPDRSREFHPAFAK